MKTSLFILALFCSSIIFGQTKLFQNQLSENNLAANQKVSNSLASTYKSTKYYLHTNFDLKSDLEFILPSSNKNIVAKYSKTYKYSNGSESAVYRIVGEPDAEFVLSKHDNIVTGMYASAAGGKVIFHQTHANIIAVSVVNEAALINQDSKDDFININATSTARSTLANANICLATTPECANSTVDVLIVYTTDAKTAWGGAAQSNSFTATAITNFNTALTNSGVTNVNINLVYTGEILYTESGNINTDLTRFYNTSDGYLDDVHALRDMYGADICSLVTATPTNTCGLGYLNTNPTNYNANWAFNVTINGCVVSNYSLVHEIGHNMGLNHDWYVSSSTVPCEHQHGYVNRTAIMNGTSSTTSQRWRTIMAYNDECADSGFGCTRINRWANPAINYNSEPTGIAIGNPQPSNEAFGFKRFSCVVAGFRPTAVLSTKETSVEINDFAIYPNPAKDILNVKTKDNQKYNFTIINALGQIILKTDSKNIDLRGWSPGEYFISIVDSKNSLIGSKKFIVEK